MLFHMKTRVGLKYFATDCSFSLKLEKLSGKRMLKFALHDNYFSDLLIEVRIWY